MHLGSKWPLVVQAEPTRQDTVVPYGAIKPGTIFDSTAREAADRLFFTPDVHW